VAARYVVLGAGAIGSTVGALLTEAGREVVLVTRGEHARAVREAGLRLATPERTATVRMDVVTEAAELDLGDDDVLLLTAKSQATGPLLDAVLAASGARERPVFCLQNGVGNELAALRRFARVHGVCVMLPAVHVEPGRVDAAGTPMPGLFRVGRFPRGSDQDDEQFVADTQAAGFAAEVSDDVMPWKYAKLLRNLWNAVDAAFGPDDATDADREARSELGRRARAEAEACLTAAGIDWVDDAEWARQRGDRVEFGEVQGRPRGGSSSWQSLVRETGSVETDALNGEIVLLGRLHDVATPVNEALQVTVTAMARERRLPGSVRPTELSRRITG
jgi:2-dehydropantoate 2-reductase